MKKIVSILATVAMIMMLIVPISASAESSTLTADKSTVSPGSKVVVTYRVPTKVQGVELSLSYDSNVLKLDSMKSKCAHLTATVSGTKIVAYANSEADKESGRIFEATFTVKDNATVGSSTKVSVSGDCAKDASNSFSGAASCTIKIGDKQSDECRLEALEVSGYQLSPSFSKDRTSYTLENVENNVTTLNVKASAMDADAKVSISGNKLSVGYNTIKVTVTAPSGKTKTYQISVERKSATAGQETGDEESTSAQLADIVPSEGQLSPEFQPAVYEYVVYVPCETYQIDLVGKRANKKHQTVEDLKAISLTIGVNELVLNVSADDGATATYKVYVVRMDRFGGADTLGLPASLIKTNEETTTEPVTEEVVAEDEKPSLATPIVIAVVAFVSILIGFLIGLIAFKKGNGDGPDDNDYDNYDDYDDFGDLDGYNEGIIDDYDEFVDISSSMEPEEKPSKKLSKRAAKKAEKNTPPEDRSKERQRSTVKKQQIDISIDEEEPGKIHYVDYQSYIDGLDK